MRWNASPRTTSNVSVMNKTVEDRKTFYAFASDVEQPPHWQYVVGN